MTDLHLIGGGVFIGKRRCGFLSRDDDDPERVWYVSPRSRKEHWFKIWKGWGIAVAIVDFLEKNNVYGVKLRIDNTGTERAEVCKMEVETSSLPNLRLHGHVEQYEGFEPQIIMAEKHWLGDGQAML